MNQIYSYQRKDAVEPKKNRPERRLVRWLFFLLLAFFLFKGFFWIKGMFGQRRVTEIPLAQKQSIETVPDPNAKYSQILNYTISAGDIPADIFSSQGKLDANDTVALLAASKDAYDFTNLKIGRSIRFYFENEVRATRIEYDRDTERVIIVERAGDDFAVREEKISYTVSKEAAKGTINNFFYADALESGLSESTVLEVGDIFSFDVDFTTEIQTGDSFSIIYEKRTRDGEKASDGNILAAKFTNVGTDYFAYYFDNDGQGGYYDADGRVLERQFLKAPLSYRHISSGFTGARRHPITRKVSAHYQIDYAAPAGTPVVASARGTVISAAWSGGWGNMVRLENDNGYTTHFGHLSAFAKGLRSGARVGQGQLIGYVGSTGWSTGPHLDYGIKLNGVPVNPLKMDMPKGEPLGGEKRQQFEEAKKQYVDLLK
jgi:murein DD-endopeptidase MepM/ murein hydrolase activator NlpD